MWWDKEEERVWKKGWSRQKLLPRTPTSYATLSIVYRASKVGYLHLVETLQDNKGLLKRIDLFV